MKYNNGRYKIKSVGGEYVDFKGVAEMGIKQCYDIKFANDTTIEATAHHKVFTTDGRPIEVCELSVGMEVLGLQPNMVVSDITATGTKQTYDVIESEGHKYYANGVLSHNCKFLSSDALLIDTMFLAQLTAQIHSLVPFGEKNGVTFWEGIQKGNTYIVGVDPATGSGDDYSVITVFSFPAMKQVAEWRKNTMSTNDLYGILKSLLMYLERMETQVYFSVENNGVGEGVIALYEADENPPVNSEFVSEEGAKRRGMTTTSRSKMKACVNFREMIQRSNLTIQSKILLQELKTYVRAKGSYAAQSGATDDCISACLIVVRLIEEIAQFEQEAFDKLYAGHTDEFKKNDWDGWDSGYDENYEADPVIF